MGGSPAQSVGGAVRRVASDGLQLSYLPVFLGRAPHEIEHDALGTYRRRSLAV